VYACARKNGENQKMNAAGENDVNKKALGKEIPMTGTSLNGGDRSKAGANKKKKKTKGAQSCRKEQSSTL